MGGGWEVAEPTAWFSPLRMGCTVGISRAAELWMDGSLKSCAENWGDLNSEAAGALVTIS